MLRRFGRNPTEDQAYVLAQTCLVVPPPASMLDALDPILSQYHRSFGYAPWPVVLFDVRRGNILPSAVQELENSVRLRLNSIEAYVLALAYYRHGRPGDAQTAITMGHHRRFQGKYDWDFELTRAILRAEVLESLEPTAAAPATAVPTHANATPAAN
jgi:hypothetical protein